MHERFERALTAAEVRRLKAESAILDKQTRRYYQFTVGLCAVAVLVGAPLSLGQLAQDSGLGILAFATTAIFLVIFVSAYRSNTKDVRRRQQSIGRIADGGRATVLRCKPVRYVAVEEIEDEGLEFFLEVDPNETLYLGGQQYYGVKKFPSSDFDLVEIENGRGETIDFEVVVRGEKLQPERTIGADEKLVLLKSENYPQDGDLLPGSCDDIEQVILGRSANDREAHS